MSDAGKLYSKDFLSKFRTDPVGALEAEGIHLTEQEKQRLVREQPSFGKLNDKQLADRISKRGVRIF